MKLKNTIRSRRLRKKLYLDEFTIYGFEVSCLLSMKQESDLDTFIDGLIVLIESRELSLGAGYDLTSFNGFVTSNERYASASDANAKAIDEWLSHCPEVLEYSVGDLVDANYGV